MLDRLSWFNGFGSGTSGPDATSTPLLPISLTSAGARTLSQGALTVPLGSSSASWSYTTAAGSGSRWQAAYRTDLSREYLMWRQRFVALGQASVPESAFCSVLQGDIGVLVRDETQAGGRSGSTDAHVRAACKMVKAQWHSLTNPGVDRVEQRDRARRRGRGYGAARALRVNRALAGAVVRLTRGRHTGRSFVGIIDYHGMHLSRSKLIGKPLLEAATWELR
jgi:hypothetical protein